MDKDINRLLLDLTKAKEVKYLERIQSLWSGYGEIARYGFLGSDLNQVIVKHISLPNNVKHPRGWNTDLSHARKVKSYDVECHFYEKYSSLCDEACRVAKLIACVDEEDLQLILMEDLDASGYSRRLNEVSWDDVKACLKWLANFHAQFLGVESNGLWDVGTYWHLATRPDELAIMEEGELKAKASQIDERLNSCSYKTFVHGDAKLANFCFSDTGHEVAAVDFQYVGSGCGMKDVIYFLGSCLSEEACEEHEAEALDYYFRELDLALVPLEKDVDFSALEKEWRELFPVAWTDFSRFLQGWSPGHWKINSYSERLARQVLAEID